MANCSYDAVFIAASVTGQYIDCCRKVTTPRSLAISAGAAVMLPPAERHVSTFVTLSI